MALIAFLVALVGVTAFAVAARRSAARAVSVEAAPMLVQAQDLYESLAAVDSTATLAFLTGAETPQLHQEYLTRLNAAGAQLASILGQPGANAAIHESVGKIVQQFPLYVGMVDSARADNRLGLPIGASYLREASDLMRGTILPEATNVYNEAAHRLDSAGRAGTSTVPITVVIIVGAAVLLALLVVQVVVARRSHRLVNVGLLTASVLVGGVLIATTVLFLTEQRDLTRGQRQGADLMQVLSASRILLLRAHTDATFALIERGTGQTYLHDFDVATRRLEDGGSGLLPEAHAAAERVGRGADVVALQNLYANYLHVAAAIRESDANGEYQAAVDALLGEANGMARDIDQNLEHQIDNARTRFLDSAADARWGFGVWTILSVLILVVAGAYTVTGLQRRIEEYR